MGGRGGASGSTWHRASDDRAARWSRFNRKAGADHRGAVGHDANAKSFSLLQILGDSQPVIFDRELDCSVVLSEVDADSFGFAVADRVAHGFLCDPVQV